MKIKGASAYTCYVNDLKATADFYQKLGLTIHDQTDNRLIIYINWYRIDFVKAEVEGEKGAGVFFGFSVDDVDETYKEIKSQGLSPATEPQNTDWGTYEFVLPDPDGYKLVFFTRKVKRNPQN